MTRSNEAGLHRLTYFSSASEEMSQAQLESILKAARANNSRHDVTGLLVYHDLQFFQALEGPRANVEKIFKLIAADPRHKGCLVLESRPVDQRIFDNWSMGYKSAGDLDSAQKQSFLELTTIRGNFAESAAGDHSNTWILLDSFLSSFRDLHFV